MILVVVAYVCCLLPQHVKRDLKHLILSSKSEWPSDFDGNYGGLFIRQAWHCSGSYRFVRASVGWLLTCQQMLHADKHKCKGLHIYLVLLGADNHLGQAAATV